MHPSRWLAGDPALHLNQTRGHLNWRVGLPALLGGTGRFNFHLYCTVYGVCQGRIYYGLHVALCFRHFTAFHYHHCARLLTGIEHMYMFLEYLVEVCLTCFKSCRLPFIFIAIYGMICVQLAHFSLGDWKDIFTAHVIISIKSEVCTFPTDIIFIVVVCLRCLLHHILSHIAYTFRENREFVFIIIAQFMSANSCIRFGFHIVFVCLYITPSHYHHCTNLSEYIELKKCLSDIFCRVCE